MGVLSRGTYLLLYQSILTNDLQKELFTNLTATASMFLIVFAYSFTYLFIVIINY